MDTFGMLFGVGITVIVLAVTGIVFWKVFLPMIKSSTSLLNSLANNAQQEQQLMATGEPAQARVVAVQGTGVLVNYNPQVRMQLEVYPASGRPPFQTECTTIIPQLAIPRVQPGATLQIRFDPTNPARVAVMT